MGNFNRPVNVGILRSLVATRQHYGPGYRVYFLQRGQTIIVLFKLPTRL